MLVPCKLHGYGPGVEISPDLSAEIESRSGWPQVCEITYEYLNEPVICMFLSKEFVAEHNIQEAGIVELPEYYPEWHDELVAVCEKCVERIIGT